MTTAAHATIDAILDSASYFIHQFFKNWLVRFLVESANEIKSQLIPNPDLLLFKQSR